MVVWLEGCEAGQGRVGDGAAAINAERRLVNALPFSRCIDEGSFEADLPSVGMPFVCNVSA